MSQQRMTEEELLRRGTWLLTQWLRLERIGVRFYGWQETPAVRLGHAETIAYSACGVRESLRFVVFICPTHWTISDGGTFTGDWDEYEKENQP